MPRYLKIQEFAAHAGNVNCIKIGRKSSGVLVTGGEDKKVNLWTIGQQTKALSLIGHQTAVDSVTFDQNEEVVAAGAASGSIKLFDLDQAKVTRALTGHRSNVLSLELNQFGLVSGSMDTNVKVWDLRRKDAIQTCKGHKKGVTHVHFSPDGKWVASGCEDGEVKLWDLVAGRPVADFNEHSHAITGLEFHPYEYLLATSSADKTVKIWDLESMNVLESTPPEATGVRAIAFHPEGQHVFSAVQDGLRVWTWEPPPPMQMDNVDVPWSKVADISVLRDKNKLVGCSFYQSIVGLWVVDLKDVRPFGSGLHGESQSSISHGPSAHTGAGSSSVSNSSSSKPHSIAVNALEGRQGSARSPSSYGAAAGAGAAAGITAGMRGFDISSADVRPAHGDSDKTSSQSGHKLDRPATAVTAAVGCYSFNNDHLAAAADDWASQPCRAKPPAPHGASQDGGLGDTLLPKAGMVSVAVGVGDSLLRGQVAPGQLHSLAVQEAAAQPAAQAQAQAQPSTSWGADAGGVGSRQSGAVFGSEMRRQPFWQAPVQPTPEARYRAPNAGISISNSSSPKMDTDVVAEISSKHDDIKQSLTYRLSHLQIARAFIGRGDLRGAVAAARRCGDATVICDLLAAVLARRPAPSGASDALFTLDCVADLVPAIEAVLSLPSEQQIATGLDVVALLLKAFGGLIQDTCRQAARVGVDLSFEQRREKCTLARMALQGLAAKLAFVVRHVGDRLAYRAQDLSGQLAAL